MELLKRLGQVGWNCNGSSGIVGLQACFTATSANGKHLCLVLPLYGPAMSNPKTLAALRDGARHGACK